MQQKYRPDLGGFANKLGIRNGIEELLKRPVPKQEILYYEGNDITGMGRNLPVSAYSLRKRRQYYRKRR